MAAVDSFHLLYREIARSCNCYVETLALVGALYTASKAVIVTRDCYRLLRLHFIPRLVNNRDLVRSYGEWAVIYGSSETLAVAYAEELAKYGINIILISSDIRSLTSTAKGLSEVYGVEAILVEADFCRGQSVCKPIQDAIRDKDVGFVVNSLDTSLNLRQSFTDLSEGRLWDALNRSITAASLVTRLALPGMVERRRGAVVNISSGACSRPLPNKAVLSASTAYLDYFSRALHYEFGHRGIFVQSLFPCRVALQAPEEGGREITSSWLVPPAQVYARHAVSTLGVSHRTTGYWPHSLQLGLVHWAPEWLWTLGSRMLATTA
ncbi:hypothetical protein AALO_G00112540 [Alosa alosa]|uniref:Inactive hydroxysteroid dehydrogenase-like protein 1 n=1 Tax=Alosa alosa TaxID=278164 RepID=A0AAV6GPH7_9TELE|nr:inactive hydroxysteroid dehydrogenase-like protein 1 [Alosa alosa]KAG5277018.1 hypothetical protein AALO_G00112540 [Alosa alosa]